MTREALTTRPNNRLRVSACRRLRPDTFATAIDTPTTAPRDAADIGLLVHPIAEEASPPTARLIVNDVPRPSRAMILLAINVPRRPPTAPELMSRPNPVGPTWRTRRA